MIIPTGIERSMESVRYITKTLQNRQAEFTLRCLTAHSHSEWMNGPPARWPK